MRKPDFKTYAGWMWSYWLFVLILGLSFIGIGAGVVSASSTMGGSLIGLGMGIIILIPLLILMDRLFGRWK